MQVRRSRVDKNQSSVVKALRDAGCSVQLLHAVGEGCPDLLVGYRGVSVPVEVKNGRKARLTPQQVAWTESWNGSFLIVRDAEDVSYVTDYVDCLLALV